MPTGLNRWAVTGVEGFIGSRLAAALLAQGMEVAGLARRGAGAGYRVVQGGLEDVPALDALVDGAEVVVHLAAYVHRRTVTAEEREACRRVNVEGTRSLLDAVERAGTHPLLVFVSTANVYGPAGGAEDAPLEPRSMYGETKLQAERLVMEARARGILDAVILRPAMVFGPGAPGNLGRLGAMLRRGLNVSLGTEAEKSLVPVDKLVAAIITVARQRATTRGEVYNVGGGPLPMSRIARVVAEAMGARYVTVRLPGAPLRPLARALDRAVIGLGLSAPSLEQLVETYRSAIVVDDRKLTSLPGFDWRGDIEEALHDTFSPGRPRAAVP